MSERCVCGVLLRTSVYLTTAAGKLKSCPRCSLREGRHVFYREETFGTRTMQSGDVIIQSWCPACRSTRRPAAVPKHVCGGRG